MGAPKIKICGLTSLHDARFAAGARADYLGFIFTEESPRYIEPGKAAAIIQWIEGPKTVGVFLNQPLDDVIEIASSTGIDLIQLHGTESPDYCNMVDLPVIKAFHIGPGTRRDELEKKIAEYRGAADYFLLDTGSKSKWGGTGVPFDWSVGSGLEKEYPLFLAGGLNPDNISDAWSVLKPYAFDISSGLEMEPGIKDFEKIEKLFDQLDKLETP
ncbi:MAG: phosphoribosylanthranilate isomerase [Balneolaceae bacterium]